MLCIAAVVVDERPIEIYNLFFEKYYVNCVMVDGNSLGKDA